MKLTKEALLVLEEIMPYMHGHDEHWNKLFSSVDDIHQLYQRIVN